MTGPRRLAWVLCAGLVAGCSRDAAPRNAPASAEAAAVPSADSLVLTLHDSMSVWLVAGRPDTSSSGEVCEERLIELRQGDRKIPVPLLYTRGAPRVLNDSTLIAPLFRHCAIEAWYVVNTRTGQPTRETGT